VKRILQNKLFKLVFFYFRFPNQAIPQKTLQRFFQEPVLGPGKWVLLFLNILFQHLSLQVIGFRVLANRMPDKFNSELSEKRKTHKIDGASRDSVRGNRTQSQ